MKHCWSFVCLPYLESLKFTFEFGYSLLIICLLCAFSIEHMKTPRLAIFKFVYFCVVDPYIWILSD